MANVAQLINNLHSLFLAREDKFVATPNFHVFEMYTAHHNAKSVRAQFNVPNVSDDSGKATALPGLAGSASIRDQRLTLRWSTPTPANRARRQFRSRGAAPQSGKGQTLAADDIHAHNSFENPTAVQPREVLVKVNGGQLTHEFPPASVTRLEVTLG